MLSRKNVRGTIPRLRYRKKEEFPGLVNIRGKTQGTHQGKRGHSVTVACACRYTQNCMHVCVLPSLPCPCPGGVGELAQHPPKGRALPRSDTVFLHSTDCIQHSFKKKCYLFACLERHKDNIHVCDPDCLWSRGKETVQTALLSSTPGMPARKQSCCLRGEGQILWPSANAVSSPSG